MPIDESSDYAQQPEPHHTLVLAVGNPLRADDGVAHVVLRSLGEIDGAACRSELQISPELAAEVARFQTVVFVDADATAEETTVAPLDANSRHGLSHTLNASTIIALAASLYRWSGRGWLCSLPACRFDHGASMSPMASKACATAVQLLRDFLQQLPDVSPLGNGNRIEKPPCNAVTSSLNPPAL